MKTITELIEAAEDVFRSEDSRLENERREAEQKRKDEWNGRVKHLLFVLNKEKKLHEIQMTSSRPSPFIALLGFLLVTLIHMLFFSVLIDSFVQQFNSLTGIFGILVLVGICVFICCYIIDLRLAKRKEEYRHAEQLEQIRADGAWLKLSGTTADQLQEELERAKIQ